MCSAVECLLLAVFLIVRQAMVVACSGQGLRRIIGGRDATAGEYPYVMQIAWRVNLTYPDKVTTKYIAHCTGAALTPAWTLTARHCRGSSAGLYEKIIKPDHVEENEMGISYGSPDSRPSENNKFSLVLDVITVPYRPARDAQLPDLSHHVILQDIALFKTEPVLIERYARVSSVDFTSLYGREVTMPGYGLFLLNGNISIPMTAGKPLQVLDKALLIPCDKKNMKLLGYRYPTPYIVYPQICAAHRCNTRSRVETLSYGDSGGPVIHSSGVVAVNVGLTDLYLVRLDGRLKSIVRPSVSYLTPTSPFVDWITSTIQSDKS